MSITSSTVNAHLNDPAVLCCLTRAGTTITPAELEDPSVFADLQDSGLLSLDKNVLTIGQALGATLTVDCDGLTPLRADVVAGASAPANPAGNAAAPAAKPIAAGDAAAPAVEPVAAPAAFTLHLDKAEGLTLTLPLGTPLPAAFAAPAPSAPKEANTVLRTLVKRYFTITDVQTGSRTSFENGVLTIDEGLLPKALDASPLVKKIELSIIPVKDRHVYSNTIMDVIPVAVKADGKLGEGITHVLEGAVFVLCGMDEAGVQVHEFGSCEGYMDEKIRYGRPGCPDADDIMIRVDVQIQEGTGMERRGPFAAHQACDVIIQAIRDAIRPLSISPAREESFSDVRRQGRPRVVLVKEIMGQGAMHDNLLVPTEPCGVSGGQKNVDLGNVPVVLSANEVLDGGLHALACIGPSTKEITRHFFREPLVMKMQADEEIDLVGVVFIGSPQVNDEKLYVAGRLGSLVEALGVEGAIVTTEGFGNNHIDFAENIAAIGSRGIAVVGATFAAYQGQLVVGNDYMDAMIELNKDEGGFENEILADNTLCPEDADRALIMLKTKMAGIPISAPDRHFSADVIAKNQRLMPL